MNRKQMDFAFQKYASIMQQAFDKNEDTIYIVGSQSIWSRRNAVSAIGKQSQEVDILPANYSDDIDTHLEFVAGEGSPFEEEHGFNIDIVEDVTLKSPTNWKERTFNEELNHNGFKLNVKFMDASDLILTKLYAARPKDLLFVEDMFRCNIVSVKKLNKILNDGEMNHLLNNDKAEYIVKKINNFSDRYLIPSKKVRFDFNDALNTPVVNDFDNKPNQTPNLIKRPQNKF